MSLRLVLFSLAFASALAGAAPSGQPIQTVPLDENHPYFIPTHPRVTTTIRFPGEIGPPEGAVTLFTEDASKHPAEYLVTWQAGDAYFTLTPLREAPMANLNVPYQAHTYVLYFYSVPDPLEAVALVNLQASVSAGAAESLAPKPPAPNGQLTRTTVAPVDAFVTATPARLIGLIDRLKLIHATSVGPDLAALVQAMNVDVAFTPEALAAAPADRAANGVAGEIASGLNDAGLYQLILLRAVRDRRLNCIGFICLLRNTSNQTLEFDVNGFGARCGAEYLGQRISDAPPVLQPGEQAAAYFVIKPPASRPLKAANAWKLTAELVAPRLNPGAALSQNFAAAKGPPP